MKTNRSLLVLILLGILTIGIYPIYFWYEYAKDINVVCEGDGKKTRGFLIVLVFSILTLGIYYLFWIYSVGDRISVNTKKRNLQCDTTGTSVLLWFILGSIIVVGPFIALYKMIDGLNVLSKDYNSRNGIVEIGNTQLRDTSNFVIVLKKNTMLIVLIAVYLFFVITTKGSIFKPMNFNALITQNAYVYILACGMLMCMLTGGNIDLSCGSFVCLLGAIGGVLMVVNKMSTGLAVVILLLVGIAYGCGLGYLVAYVRIPPWIATLAGYLAFRGLGTSILSANSSTGSIAPFPDDFLKIFSGKVFQTKMSVFNVPCMTAGAIAAAIVVVAIFWTRATRLKKGYTADSIVAATVKSVLSAGVILLFMYKLANAGGIPTVLIWVVAVVLIYSFITSKTTVGRHFYVVGGNMEAARLSGVNTRMIMFLAYLNMAVLTAISAMTVMARFTAANSTAGTNFEMDAISACVVGGVSASGGAGSIMGMVIGATLIGVINLGMSLMGIDANFQKVVKGVVLLGAVAFDILSKKRER